MKSFKTVIALAIGSLFAGAAFAQSNFEIEQRDRNEQARINQGVRSGELTYREANMLQGERAQIERMERRARADGVMTQGERARIDSAQDRLSRDIRRESNDRQTSNGYGRNSDRRFGWDRGNGNGWGRGNDQGNHYGWGRGNEHGNNSGNQQSEHHDGTRGQSNETHGQSNETHGNGVTPRTGGETHTGQWNNGRQASMPQAQTRSTPSQGTRTFAAASGGNSGRRTR